jgi:hypothetical protein
MTSEKIEDGCFFRSWRTVSHSVSERTRVPSRSTQIGVLTLSVVGFIAFGSIIVVIEERF